MKLTGKHVSDDFIQQKIDSLARVIEKFSLCDDLTENEFKAFCELKQRRAYDRQRENDQCQKK